MCPQNIWQFQKENLPNSEQKLHSGTKPGNLDVGQLRAGAVCVEDRGSVWRQWSETRAGRKKEKRKKTK